MTRIRKISMVVAVAKNGAIGRKGQLLYHIKEDMRHFRQITMGHAVIMGRKTWESLPGALSGRNNIVVTRDNDYKAEGAVCRHSLEAALDYIKSSEEAMVIGGGQLYAEALSLIQNIYMTVIDDSPDNADTFFPDLNPDEWTVTQESETFTDPVTELKYRYICLTRK